MPPLCGDKRLREREREPTVCTEVQTGTEVNGAHILCPTISLCVLVTSAKLTPFLL